ncbi:GtrA family protein [Gammaproteobacteria bacterium]|nr:GtrA family protein [Gammaproteobacteria bacterium]
MLVLKEFFNTFKRNTLFRFIIAGIINTLFGLTLGVIFLRFLPFHYSLSLLLLTCIAPMFNYFMSLKYVFNSPGNTSGSNKKLGLFFSVYLFMYFVHVLLMSVLINQVDLDDIIAYLISAPFIIVMTYILQKKIVFNK